MIGRFRDKLFGNKILSSLDHYSFLVDDSKICAISISMWVDGSELFIVVPNNQLIDFNISIMNQSNYKRTQYFWTCYDNLLPSKSTEIAK